MLGRRHVSVTRPTRLTRPGNLLHLSHIQSRRVAMLRLSAAAAALLAFAASTVAAQNAQYHVVKRMPLGRIRADYIIVDPAGRRLYGFGENVINVDADTVVGTVAGGGGGFAIAADQNRGLVRNGVVFDLTTLAVTGHVDVNGDGIRYDPVDPSRVHLGRLERVGRGHDDRHARDEDRHRRRARIRRGRRARQALPQRRGLGVHRALRRAGAQDRGHLPDPGLRAGAGPRDGHPSAAGCSWRAIRRWWW